MPKEHDVAPFRWRTNLVPHTHFSLEEQGDAPIHNLILSAGNAPEWKWLEDTSRRIADFRSTMQSAYIRWSLAINGLEKARDRYRNGDQGIFYVHTLRAGSNGAQPVRLAQWSYDDAATNHEETMPMLPAFGIIDLYSLF